MRIIEKIDIPDTSAGQKSFGEGRVGTQKPNAIGDGRLTAPHLQQARQSSSLWILAVLCGCPYRSVSVTVVVRLFVLPRDLNSTSNFLYQSCWFLVISRPRLNVESLDEFFALDRTF